MSALLVVCPAACAREAHSDGAQSVCSPVASSTEAFQLLQGDLTKISCPLLNYNLPSTALSFSPLLSISDRKIGLPLCFAANWCVCLCVRDACMYVWSCLGCQRKKCVRWLAGHASEVGQQGDQELKLSLSAPFHFSSSISLFFFLPVVMTSCLLRSFLLAPPVLSLRFHLPFISRFPSSSPPSLDTSFHLPLSPRVVASDNVICISVVFSWSVKLWNPLIETDYERTFLGFSLLDVCPGYVQLGTLSSPGKKEWNNWWCVIVPALVALIQHPRAFLTFGALNHK